MGALSGLLVRLGVGAEDFGKQPGEQCRRVVQVAELRMVEKCWSAGRSSGSPWRSGPWVTASGTYTIATNEYAASIAHDRSDQKVLPMSPYTCYPCLRSVHPGGEGNEVSAHAGRIAMRPDTRTPTRVRFGRHDSTSAPGAIASQFPNVASFTSVPRAKLFFYEEQPELVAGWLEEFVTGVNEATTDTP